MEEFVVTLIFVVSIMALLTVAGLFALMQIEKQREGQSGTPNTASDGAKQGRRAAGMD